MYVHAATILLCTYTNGLGSSSNVLSALSNTQSPMCDLAVHPNPTIKAELEARGIHGDSVSVCALCVAGTLC